MRGDNNRHKLACKYGHKFTPENIYINATTGFRQCRECQRERSRARGKALASRHGTYRPSRPAGRGEVSARVAGLMRVLARDYDERENATVGRQAPISWK